MSKEACVACGAQGADSFVSSACRSCFSAVTPTDTNGLTRQRSTSGLSRMGSLPDRGVTSESGPTIQQGRNGNKETKGKRGGIATRAAGG
ncbi:MAG: hypothetical protein Kow0067_02580 [Coriobacteriia bacterium]